MKFIDKCTYKCNNYIGKGGRNLSITYDFHRLQKIINDFTKITEISLNVLDSNFNKIASSYNTNRSEFCMQIQSTKEGKNKCICSDEILLKRCAENRRPEIHICHAGLTDAAIPLIENDEIIGYILLGRIRRTRNLNIDNKVTSLGDNLISSFNNLVYYNDSQLQSAINLAVAITSHILTENIIKRNYDPVVYKAITYIDNNLNKDLSVNTLCEELNISKNTLYEHFRYTVKTTVGDYITERRMLKARKLLSSTEKSILAIAEECGIYNYTYFIKLFKKQTGITPYRYRINNPNK